MATGTFRFTPMCVRWHAISLLFSEAPHFLNSIFDSTRRELDQVYCFELMSPTSCADPSVRALLMLALMIWNDESYIPCMDDYQDLAEKHYNCLQMAVDLLANPNHPEPCRCDYCDGFPVAIFPS